MPKSYTLLCRKPLKNILHKNEGIHQERGRHKTQGVGKGNPHGDREGMSQEDSWTTGLGTATCNRNRRTDGSGRKCPQGKHEINRLPKMLKKKNRLPNMFRHIER